MKGKSIFCVLVVLVAVSPAWAEYLSIQHNMINGTPDTAYNASTGVLTWSSTNAVSVVLLNASEGSLGGTFTNVTASLITYLHHYDPSTKKATFTNGSFSLDFTRNGISGYNIGGPISGMVLGATSTTAIGGEGLFNAGEPTLPPDSLGDSTWPAAGLSSIKSLTIDFAGLPGGQNYDWSTNLTGPVETQYTLFPNPNAAPEPTSLLLLLGGSLLVSRRRRRA